MAEVWDTVSGEGTWNPRFMRSFNDWEMDKFQNFINLINNKKNQSIGKRQIALEGG